MEEMIDGVLYTKIGENHWIAPYTNGDKIGGYIEMHLKPDGSQCWGSVALEGSLNATPGRTWQVLQEEPLTLHPSLLRTICGNHGWIRNGEWVDA